MKNIALRVAGAIFLLIAIGHILRFVNRTPISMSGISIPVSLSAIASIIMLLLAFWMFSAGRK